MRNFLCAFASLFLALFTITSVHANTSPVVFSEIQISGSGNSDDDFIEVYNATSLPIDMTGWKLKKKVKSGKEYIIYNFKVESDEKIIIPANGYFLWSNKDGDSSKNTLLQFTNNSVLSDNYSLALFDGRGDLVDSLTYGSEHTDPYSPSIAYYYSGKMEVRTSLERDLEKNIFLLQNNPTPKNNAFIEKQTIKEEDDGSGEKFLEDISIRINEIFPDPKEKGEDSEFIEIFNFGTDKIDLSGFALRDASKTGAYVFPASETIDSGEYLAIYKEKSKISLNNSDETISLFDPKNNLIDSVEYNKTKEEASFGFDGENFRWSKYGTPGEANKFDALPTSKTSIPKKAYKDVAISFSAKGSKPGYKFTWDFGDKTKSYKQETTHIYKKKGKYKGSLTIDNGFEETKKYFTVKVEKYPTHSISVTAFSANPQGTDSENEYLLVKNNGKKKVDLKGWSVATGTNNKKLLNHPINGSFAVKKGEEKRLTHAFSAFSLPNKSGFIELRQPNGKPVQKIAYDKSDGIKNGEVYSMQSDKKWLWENQPFSPAIPGNDLNDDDIDAGLELEKEKSLTPKTILLEDLSPDQRAILEMEVEKKLREKIMEEIRADMLTSENQNSPDEDMEQNNPAENSSPEMQSKFIKQEKSIMEYLSLKKIMGKIFLKANASINDFLVESE
ncbi:MAG TPA: hypothetical protein DIC35_02270 [Candidatus Moranbacteria bacterium]|nr:hypothetical protein [Candidatus Moranbacteria bacterium]